MIKQFFINPYSFKPEIFASVGTSTSPTSTGTKAVTGVGFQPKVVIPFGVGQTTDGFASTVLYSFGAATNSYDASIGIRSANGISTSRTVRSHTNSECVSFIDNTFAATNITAEKHSFDADGFTLNWTAVDGTARILNHICLGGAGLEVSLTQHQMNSDNTPQSFAHGLSGEPTGLIFFGAGDNATPPVVSNILAMNFGAWAGGNAFASRVYSADAVATTDTKRELRNDCSLAQGTINTSRSLQVSSVDSLNVNCVYPITTSKYNSYFNMLAIRGAKCQVGVVNGSSGPYSITTPGINPKLFLCHMMSLGVENINSTQETLQVTIGVSDGVNNLSCSLSDRDAITTTQNGRTQISDSINEIYWSNNTFSISTVQFEGESAIFNNSFRSNNQWVEYGYIIIGS